MAKTKTTRTKAAQLAVAQVYWNRDQEYKRAEQQRALARDLALTAIPLGDCVGPVGDLDDMPHWLSHGERESVEMDAGAVYDAFNAINLPMDTALSVMRVDIADLRQRWPGIYIKVLKHRSTRSSTHSCLTWSDKRPSLRAGISKRPGAGRKRASAGRTRRG